MKLTNLFLKLLICICVLTIQLRANDDEDEGPKPWCWVKPDPATELNIWNPNIGGANWGVCLDKTNVPKVMIDYEVIIQSSNIGDYSKDLFQIQFFGDAGKTDVVNLATQGFEKGSRVDTTVLAEKVGNIEQIRLITTGKTPYQCTHIQVEIGPKFWVFDCDGLIHCPERCYSDLPLRGTQRYEISVITEEEPGSGTKLPVYIQLFGTLGKTPVKLLSELGFKTGETQHFDVMANDIGIVEKIKVILKDEDTYAAKKIIVKRAGLEESTYEPKGEILNCPTKCDMTIANIEKPIQIESPDGAQDSAQADEPAEVTNEEAADLVNNFAGAALSTAEKANMVELTCEEVVLDNPKFGPVYVGQFPNYKMVIAKCPAGCSAPSAQSTVGVGIHAQESSVCRAAILDRSLPLYGGVIGVNILTGLAGYQGGEPYHNIQPMSRRNSLKSFTTYKIDNTDLSESDIRILNANGESSHAGRLEFRQNGIWGTACMKEMNDWAARVICRQLKYNDGKMGRDGESNTVCEGYKGQNYCGVETQDIWLGGIQCTENDVTLEGCFKRNGKENDCKHSNDAIIECSIKNFDMLQNPDVGTVRLVSPLGVPVSGKEGRLEVFMNHQWGTVCNQGFTKNEAIVACRLMGYDDGDMIGDKNAVGTCSDFLDQDWCGADTVQMNAKITECEGGETALKDCQQDTNTSDCVHQQDVMISCNGEGDNSGKSQYGEDDDVPPPPLGKLPFPPIQAWDCSTTHDLQIFNGDIGSVIYGKCPELCADKEGQIWGTGIYTRESSICRAAIHSGVITDAGGIIAVTKQPGLNDYYPMLQRSIQSNEFKIAESSFTVSAPNNIGQLMTRLWDEARPVSQSPESENGPSEAAVEEGEDLSVSIPEEGGDGGFPSNEEGEEAPGQSEDEVAAAAAFIQLKQVIIPEIPDAILEWWMETPTFLFSGNTTKIDTDEIPGHDLTASLKAFTMVVTLELDEFKSKQITIIGHSGCACYALVIDPKGQIVLKTRCNGPDFETGFYIQLDKLVNLAVVYDNDKKEAQLWVDGAWFSSNQIKFDFKCEKKFDIGRYSETLDEFFDGKILFIKIYDTPLNKKQIKYLSTLRYEHKPFKAGDSGADLTMDRRKCISACAANPFPGAEGAPNPPDEALLGQGGNAGTATEGVSCEDLEDESSFKDLCDTYTPPPKEKPADCFKTGEDIEGVTGDQVIFDCPADCGKQEGVHVFGLQIYHESTAICEGAVHAGIIKEEYGGQVLIVIANGMAFYQGLMQNGIYSLTHSEGLRSIVFKKVANDSSNDAQEDENDSEDVVSDKTKCEMTAVPNNIPGGENLIAKVDCPAGCAQELEGTVFGDKIYTDDSSVCLAAIHYGIISDMGGEVQIRITGEQLSFMAVERNGVQSAARGTYIRGFEVLGDPTAGSVYYNEQYNPPDVNKNWEQVTLVEGAVEPPADWQFNTNPTDNKGLAIIQEGMIYSEVDFVYGTFLINKIYEGAHGIYHASVYVADKLTGRVAVVFKYRDQENYFAVEMNPNESQQIRLVEVVNAKGTVLATCDLIAMIPDTWHTFHIVMIEKDIRVYVQQSAIGPVKLMMEHKIEGLDLRGRIGVATNEQKGVYFDGVSIELYYPEGEKFEEMDLNPNFDSCIVTRTPLNIHKDCVARYKGFATSELAYFINDCIEPHQYCDQCCSKLIEEQQNLWFSSCFQKCVRNVKMYAPSSDDEESSQDE